MVPGILIAALLAQASALAAAPSPPPPPACAGPEFHQLDFWVGTWDIEYDQADGETGTATNVITRGGMDECAIIEDFSMPNGFRGTSLSAFDRNVRQWRQMWVDNQGGSFTLLGGPVQDRDHIFELVTVNPVGAGRTVHRMIWEDVTPNSLVWRWQSQAEGGSWVDRWVLRYRRRAS